MQRHHSGSGRRVAIPEDWSEHHRPILEGTRSAIITLRHPGGTPGAFDAGTGIRASTPFAAYFTGPARIQAMSANEMNALAGEQEVSTLGYAVMLDYAVTGIEVDDVLSVIEMDDNGDADLIGRELAVEAVVRGSLHWERRLLCSANLESQGT